MGDITVSGNEYYADKENGLYIRNNKIEVELPLIPDESVDLVFADPPFNVKKDYVGSDKGRESDNLSPEEYYAWCDWWIGECFRILKPTGSFYLMNILKHAFEMHRSMSKHGVFIDMIPWKNASSTNDDRRFKIFYQPILVFGKTDEYYFDAYAEEKVSYFAKNTWNKDRQASLRNQMPNIWDDISLVYAGSIVHPEAILKPGTKKKAHQAQMPEALPGRAIKFSTKPGDIVVDPFVGSGTTLSAAYKLKRKGIGLEQSEYYCGLSKDRLDKLKHNLFADTQVELL